MHAILCVQWRFLFSLVFIESKLFRREGRHSTEVVFALLNLQPQVQILKLPKNSGSFEWRALNKKGAAYLNECTDQNFFS